MVNGYYCLLLALMTHVDSKLSSNYMALSSPTDPSLSVHTVVSGTRDSLSTYSRLMVIAGQCSDQNIGSKTLALKHWLMDHNAERDEMHYQRTDLLLCLGVGDRLPILREMALSATTDYISLIAIKLPAHTRYTRALWISQARIREL